MKPHILLVITILLCPLIAASYSQSAYERELNQLVEQRDKALAAASSPINARFRASAEQLLRRATQGGDLDAANKIKAALETNIEPAPAAIKDLRKQLGGTTWKSVAGMSLRPGLAETLSFTEKTVEPGDYKYEVDRFNTVIITFKFGDKQVMTLTKGGTRMQLTHGANEHAYELVPK